MTDSIRVGSLTSDPASWKGQSLVSVTQLDNSGFDLLVEVAQQMKTLVKEKGGDDRCKHQILATVFYEASTRTSGSFQAAMQRLGGTILHVDGQGNSSAAKKKETLEDTIKCLECYVDAVVLRHPETGSVPRVAQATQKPLISGGDGIGEHPTQALLDSFTMYDELQAGPKIVVMLGDLKHGRTVHSLAKLLAQLRGSELTIRYCSPASLEVPDYVKDFCEEKGVTQEFYRSLEEAVKDDAQVLYVTRVQKERFASEAEYNVMKVRLLV